MFLLYVLLVWQAQAVSRHQFNMYIIDSRQDGHCLLYYENRIDSRSSDTLAHEIIPFCLRSLEESTLIADLNFHNKIDTNYTFAELRDKNISSQMLLSWSASIDLAERFEIFLSRNISSFSLPSSPSSAKDQLFYNCTSQWFGPRCRFAFDAQTSWQSFDRIVRTHFHSKSAHEKNGQLTCYKHLNCETLFFCLDWREVCDRKVDCLDGSDEFNCWQLEINECAENEYRCYNGQCIPGEFFRDVPSNPDCLDTTDEPVNDYYYGSGCHEDPTFRCEEHTCRPGEAEFSCGDGRCVDGISDCLNGRDRLFVDNLCSRAMACSMGLYYLVDLEWCKTCEKKNCSKDTCSQFEFPSGPVLFGHVRFIFAYQENKSVSDKRLPEYVCYNENLCADFLPATVYLNNSACRSFRELGLGEIHSNVILQQPIDKVRDRFRPCLVVSNETHYCNHSTIYRCQNSTKCISKHRLVDGIQDCPFLDDENFDQSCSLNDAHQRFICLVGNGKMCFASLTVRDGKKDCKNGEDEHKKEQVSKETHINFQIICDGIVDLAPILIDGRNETDETECEHWLCNNTYTRCNGFWSCKDGADEINCEPSTCPSLHHRCVFLTDISKVSCLPINRAGDGIVDCLGAWDERNYCHTATSSLSRYLFRCQNSTKCVEFNDLCDLEKNCQFRDDEAFCQYYDWPYYNDGVCDLRSSDLTAVENFICTLNVKRRLPQWVFFIIRNIPIYPILSKTEATSSTSSTQMIIRSIQSSPIVNIKHAERWLCNRGIPIRIRVNGDKHEIHCLCPPSYYGDTCQYQNQRISLTLQVRVTSDWRSVFTFVITLIDEERNIESHEHIEYLSTRDCDAKFNVHLLYSTRPKNTSKNYSIQIDAFNKWTLNYRASWIFPLQYPFLPVHRLPVLLTVPFTHVEPFHTCKSSCIHGQCFSYVNDKRSTFCRCEPGWLGIHCSIRYRCDCAPNSLCISDTICVCPRNRFGSRCYLQSACNSELCENGGQCIPTVERYTISHLNKSTCVCLQEYYGDRCQYRQTRIDISFHSELIISQSILLHFIRTQNKAESIRGSTIKRIPSAQNSVSVFISIAFNIAFVEMFDNYYLIILREQAIASVNISTKIVPSHRCPSIDELFNKTFANQHLLKRIKYYHIPCQERIDLVCFYDEVHFCLCDLARRANCFEFDHNMTFDCRGYNLCENGGQCFQDDPKCPTSAICGCLECYYGSRCQLSTKGSALSLDAILGYHIHPRTGISRQSIVVKISAALTTTIFSLGFVGSFFSFLTFRRKKICTVGCGLYLLTSSVTSMIIMCVFAMKFWFLLVSQMISIGNRSFVLVQCVCVDFLLRLLVSTNDWLSACVAIERAINVSIGIDFNKQKSKHVAKWIILVVFLFTISTHIHDPISRQLINDEEEQRMWCVTKYSSTLQIFDWVVNIVHFSIPFATNFISALVIVITAARRRSNVKKSQSYKKILREQFQRHKHLLISPFILILLAIPRLIISFLSGCMKSARNPWLYLIGFFSSLNAPMLNFAVFILPSAMYKKEFRESMKKVWSR